jgi:uncharacterized repeat protein (TIGR03847 family)
VGESYELDPVDWITAGAVGEPGRRTFYIQAKVGHGLVALTVEKGQVRMLAQLAQELLSRIDVTVTPDHLDTSTQQLLEPVVPSWRAGALSLGMEEGGERFLLEAEELVLDDEDLEDDVEPEGGVARFWMTREQLVALAAHSAFSVEAGARETCRLCSRPVDAVNGHVCPTLNGHGPLSV